MSAFLANSLLPCDTSGQASWGVKAIKESGRLGKADPEFDPEFACLSWHMTKVRDAPETSFLTEQKYQKCNE